MRRTVYRLVAVLLLAGAATTGCTAPSPGEVTPPPVLDQTAIDALAAQHRAVAVAAAQASAAAADAVARTTLEAARSRQAQAAAARPEAATALASATAARRAADDEVQRLADRLVSVASETFQLSQTEGHLAGGRFSDLLEGGDRFAHRADGATYGEAALQRLLEALADARARSAERAAAVTAASRALASADEALGAATDEVTAAEAEVARVASAGEAAVERALRTGETTPVGSEGPTIMGAALVGASDMAAFARAGGAPHPSVDVDELAATFLSEGEAEGVRGDIAFVQALLETGWFSFHNSMVDPQDHNYAGIGACDSCSDGYGYATVELGVRAQIQLLRAYAQADLTAGDYAHPAVRTLPENLGVRGCCDTWMALSGVWATGPGYGQKILAIYDDLLAFAVVRSSSA